MGYSPRGHKESETAGQRGTAQRWCHSPTSRLCSGVVKIMETRENKGRKRLINRTIRVNGSSTFDVM